MDRNNVNWRGNFTAVVTPFTRDGELDEPAFCANLDLLISEGIDGFVVAGHTGESWALSDEERLRIFALAVDTAGGRVPVIGGVSAIRTPDAVRLAQGAEALKLDGVMMTAPAYAMVGDREVVAHVQAVSDNCDLPIMLYNIPRRVGRPLSPALIDRLADVEKVVALKQSSPSFNEIAEVVQRSGDRLLVFAGGSAERGLPAVTVGADGFVSSVETQGLGAEAISLFRLSAEGPRDQALAVQRKCADFSRKLHEYGTDPAALKAVMNHLGRPGGYPRPPVLPLTEQETEELLAWVDENIAVRA